MVSCKKNLMLPHATPCYFSTSCLGTFRFFQRLKITLYFSLSVLLDTFFKTTRITTAVPVSLSSPTKRSSVSPLFPWKQKEKAYQTDISTDPGESPAGHNAVFPLTAIQLHSKHGMYQGLRK